MNDYNRTFDVFGDLNVSAQNRNSSFLQSLDKNIIMIVMQTVKLCRDFLLLSV